MLGRYWGIILAIIAGLVVLVCGGYVFSQQWDASEQLHSTYDYQPAAQSHRLVVGPAKTPAREYQPSCNNPNTQEKADLCAQWAAVEQVGEANRLASVNLRLGLLALVFTIVGTGFLVWTFTETRATSRRELRAYVFPHEMEFERTLELETGNVVIAIYVHIRNDGSTPTSDMQIQLEHSFTLDEVAQFRNIGPRGQVTPLGPHSSVRTPGTKLREEDALAVFKGDKELFVFGGAFYGDVFGARNHVTRFCYKVSFAKQGETPIINRMAWQHWGLHNCADRECRRNQRLAETRASSPANDDSGHS